MTSALTEQPTSVAERVRLSVASDDPRHSLRGDSVRFLRTVALSVGIQGPTAGVIVGPAVLAGIVGGAGALAYLLALVAMSFVAYAFILFTRSFNSSSSVYAFNGSTLGARYGFVSVWLLLLVYVSFAAGVYASTADIAEALLASLGVHCGVSEPLIERPTFSNPTLSGIAGLVGECLELAPGRRRCRGAPASVLAGERVVVTGSVVGLPAGNGGIEGVEEAGHDFLARFCLIRSARARLSPAERARRIPGPRP